MTETAEMTPQEAREELRSTIKRAREELRDVLENYPRPDGETLYRLKTQTIQGVRREMRKLIHHDWIRDGELSSLYANSIINRTQRWAELLEADIDTTAMNRERLPGVVERLRGVRAEVDDAVSAVRDAEEYAKELKAERFHRNPDRREIVEGRAKLLTLVGDFRDTLTGDPPKPERLAAWQDHEIVTELETLRDEDAPEGAKEAMTKAIDHVDAREYLRAWVHLEQLADRFEKGELEA